MAKKHTITELNKLWREGESADSALFSEIRSNICLHSGDHYKKTAQVLRERLKTSSSNEGSKLKLTKNHIQVITKTYISNIVSQAPGIKVLPFNPKELQDQKDAEISQSVWSDAEIKQDVDAKIDSWAMDYVVAGEMAARIYWDPNKGKLKGYSQAIDEETGLPLFKHPTKGVCADECDEMGNPLEPHASEEPVFEGELCIESIHPYNLIRSNSAETMNESPFIGYRRMAPVEDVKAMIKGHENEEELEKFITESSETTFKVFEATTGEYAESRGQVLIKEYYFRKSSAYPEGYFYITTDAGILFEGPLPFSIFPIITEGFDSIPSSPRSRSIIKALRGPQAEINRMSSQIATTQISLGDDKVITQTGSKLTKGSSWSGLREFQISGGAAPTIMAGRSGDQFEASLAREVNEIYKLANLDFELADNNMTDAYAAIYKSLSQKKKYAMYVKKFERFLSNVAKTYLMLSKRYLPDDYLIKAAGKREYVNLAEFRDVSDEGFNIKLKPVMNDVDSMMGKQLNINQILQYVGKDLPKEAVGRMLRMLPFMNESQAFDHMTIDDECIDADILALDRGEPVPVKKNDNHDLYITRLNHRTKQTDYRLLPPEIQALYDQKISEHEQVKAQQLQEIKAAQSEFIPSGGGLVKLDVYDSNGKRMVVPYESAQWLIQKMQQQGQAQDQLQMQEQSVQNDILQKAQAMSQQQMDQSQQQGQGLPPLQGLGPIQ